EPKPEPEFSPQPAQPMFSQETRDVIARLVAAGRVDLVIAVTERRISPFQAARIADRGERRRTVSKDEQKAEQVEPKAKKKPVEPEVKKKRASLDPRALIA